MATTTRNKIAIDVAKILLSINAMTFRINPPYTYTTGMKSPVYLDNRLIMSYPEHRDKIVEYYVKTIGEHIGLSNVDWISATATAAIPQGAWVADRLKLPMVFVRPSTKMHGKGSKVEGYIRKGAQIVIIEDHVSTATSIAGNVESIRELGGVVKYCVSTTTYETETAKKVLDDLGITLLPLTTAKVIVQTALGLNIISKKEKAEVDRWFVNPKEWSME